MSLTAKLSAGCLAVVAVIGTASAAEDVVLSDFTADGFGKWTSSGDAFAAPSTIPEVKDKEGKVLKPAEHIANSFAAGDEKTGKLASPEFEISRNFISFNLGGNKDFSDTAVNLVVGGRPVRTTSLGKYRMVLKCFEVADLKGKKAVFEVVDADKEGGIQVGSVLLTDTLPTPYPEITYEEETRPQFHFSSARNWINDPNGMLYYDGEYHLFFQHNPYGKRWGEMTWGHAISTDMIHWKQYPHAVHPDRLGTCFSGTAVVDVNNTAGFRTGKEQPIIAIYTAATKGPSSQCIAYSNDRGRTFVKYKNNPVLPNTGGRTDRDPKVFWYEPAKRWIMVLYLERGRNFGFFNSRDLKTWAGPTCKIPGFHECPEFFELAVANEDGVKKWVMFDAGHNYLVGDFDGEKFTPVQEKAHFDHGNSYYAAQTFNFMPKDDNRRIIMGWMRRTDSSRLPCTHFISIPSVMTLRKIDGKYVICKLPVKELAKLYTKTHDRGSFELKEGAGNPFEDVKCPLLDIEAEMVCDGKAVVTFDMRGSEWTCDLGKGTLNGRPCPPVDGKLKLRFLVDNGTLEVFAQDGRLSMTNMMQYPRKDRPFSVSIKGDPVKFDSFQVRELKSIWR